jgi:hypothetical protein
MLSPDHPQNSSGWACAADLVAQLERAASKVRAGAAAVTTAAGASVYAAMQSHSHCSHPSLTGTRQQDECNQLLNALLAWTNLADNPGRLREPLNTAALLRALRGTLPAAAAWGSASVRRQAAQLMLKVIKAAGANSTGERRPRDAAAVQQLHEELLLTAAALLRLAVSLPGDAGTAAAAAAADTAPLYLQVHTMVRAALLATRDCLAAAPDGDEALRETVMRAVRPAAAQAAQADGDGWLPAQLQALMTSGAAAAAAGKGGGKASNVCRSPTPQRTPQLRAATPPLTGGAAARGQPQRRQQLRMSTPPPSPAPDAAAAAAHTPPAARTRGGDQGAAAAAPAGEAPAAAASHQAWRHGVQLAVSGVQTWGVLAQLLGAGMLRDKAAGQVLLNVSRGLRRSA